MSRAVFAKIDKLVTTLAHLLLLNVVSLIFLAVLVGSITNLLAKVNIPLAWLSFTVLLLGLLGLAGSLVWLVKILQRTNKEIDYLYQTVIFTILFTVSLSVLPFVFLSLLLFSWFGTYLPNESVLVFGALIAIPSWKLARRLSSYIVNNAKPISEGTSPIGAFFMTELYFSPYTKSSFWDYLEGKHDFE